ncbi:MAG TPA: hypothetical protein VMW80_13705 [Candidatus Dormibacteraeota bacterium]|nr:hypothetical protein [Candidatus Dormibacteraeota bacterium]
MTGSRLRALAIAGTGVLLVLLLSAAGTTTRLTSSQATKVVVQYYKSNQQANSSLDSSLLNTLEEGISATMDDHTYSLLTKAGATSETSPPIPTDGDVSISLSGASHPPAEFLAQIKWPAVAGATPVAAQTQYLVLRKDSQSKPWRVLYEPFIEKGAVLPGLSAKNAVTKSGGSNAEFSDWAKYLGGAKERFAPGQLTSKYLATTKQETATALSGGVGYSVSYAVDSTPVTTVSVRGGTLEFGSIDEHDESQPTQSGNCIQTATSENNQLLALAPAGVSYASVTAQYLYQAVIFVPQDHHKLPQVLGWTTQLMTVSAPACS